ncbi:MAG TPA: hypothetical protein VJC17_03170 [Candidatus Dojkabacteria bacterium]|nr:hypothetical protein [Candidatus Dojkabacteria bacterium]
MMGMVDFKCHLLKHHATLRRIARNNLLIEGNPDEILDAELGPEPKHTWNEVLLKICERCPAFNHGCLPIGIAGGGPDLSHGFYIPIENRSLPDSAYDI